jgi:hypothetical protein
MRPTDPTVPYSRHLLTVVSARCYDTNESTCMLVCYAPSSLSSSFRFSLTGILATSHSFLDVGGVAGGYRGRDLKRVCRCSAIVQFFFLNYHVVIQQSSDGKIKLDMCVI